MTTIEETTMDIDFENLSADNLRNLTDKALRAMSDAADDDAKCAALAKLIMKALHVEVARELYGELKKRVEDWEMIPQILRDIADHVERHQEKDDEEKDDEA